MFQNLFLSVSAFFTLPNLVWKTKYIFSNPKNKSTLFLIVLVFLFIYFIANLEKDFLVVCLKILFSLDNWLVGIYIILISNNQ